MSFSNDIENTDSLKSDGDTDTNLYDIQENPQPDVIYCDPYFTSCNGQSSSSDFFPTNADKEHFHEFSFIQEKENFGINEVVDLSSNGIESNKLEFPPISENEEFVQQNFPQNPSAGFPDQANPEKYLNNNQETLEKGVNSPVFYNDVADQFVILSQ